MTLRKKLKLRNELREWATALLMAMFVFFAYGVAAYFDAM